MDLAPLALAKGNSDASPYTDLIGTSGTLMKVNLGNRAALEPGEAINIPIWLRGVGGGSNP